MLDAAAIFEEFEQNFDFRPNLRALIPNFVPRLFDHCAVHQTRGGLKWLCFDLDSWVRRISATSNRDQPINNTIRIAIVSPGSMDTGNMCCEVVTSHVNPFCDFSSTTSAVTTPDAAPEPSPSPFAVPLASPKSEEDERSLYTEINIPLPAVPALPRQSQQSQRSQQSLSPPVKSRSRAVSLSSLSPFRRRSSSISSSGRTSEEWPRIKKEVKNREVAAAMNLNHQSKRTRSGTIDALAVVPAVLVLSAELFTPGQSQGGSRKDSGVGRWEDGIR